MSQNGRKPQHPTIMLVVPTRGMVHIKWALSFRGLAPPLGVTMMQRVVPGRDVIEARNIAVREAIYEEAEFLMFLDDDVLVGDHAIPRLFKQMRWHPDWDLITGIVTTKNDLAEPCIFRTDTPGPFWDWKFPDVFPIDACGMALCLIRMEKVKKMPEPWFDWPKGYDSEGKMTEEGEDIYFCRGLREAGGTIMADGGLLAGHLHTEKDRVFMLDEDSPPIRNAKEGAFAAATILGG